MNSLREEHKNIQAPELLLGIDIGTTNISAVLIRIADHTVAETFTIPNNTKLSAEPPFFEYDAHRILQDTKSLLDSILDAHPHVKSIGITGQMHGIVYVDSEGSIVSPLYSWQDGRGNLPFRNHTCSEEIRLRTGYNVPSGYGYATLFANHEAGLEPPEASSFCTVMDSLILFLTENSVPCIHPTNAASLGLYDLQNHRFDCEAAAHLALSHLAPPHIVSDHSPAGYYRNIPIAPAIGDNQASVYGSVREESGALLNFGTGSQISVVTDQPFALSEELELRPHLFGKFLLCGCALCGGKAYAIAEQFFSAYAAALTGQVSSQYETMNALAEKAYLQGTSLNVSTRFCGTRKDPSLRGSVTGLSETNLTPGDLILGVLRGMAEELKSYYDAMQIQTVPELVASGNAVQKNPVLVKVLQDVFALPVQLSAGAEEAATGAALYAGILSGTLTPEQRRQIITYR